LPESRLPASPDLVFFLPENYTMIDILNTRARITDPQPDRRADSRPLDQFQDARDTEAYHTRAPRLKSPAAWPAGMARQAPARRAIPEFGS
jgi:hypothetical protein